MRPVELWRTRVKSEFPVLFDALPTGLKEEYAMPRTSECKAASYVDTSGLRSALTAFFTGREPFGWTGLGTLPDVYRWPRNRRIPLDRLHGIHVDIPDDESFYQQNVELKRQLSEIWKTADADQRFEIARWIIKDWGGISAIGDDKVRIFVRDAERKADIGCADRAASCSKVLATVWPDEFCIYDSRVSVSLKAVQLLAGIPPMVVFAFVQGRGKLTRKGSGFTSRTEFKRVLARLEHQWQFVHKDDSYSLYNSVMRRLARELSRPPHDLEMLLFAEAERLTEKCGIRMDGVN